MYNDENMASAEEMEKMRLEFERKSGKFEPYRGGDIANVDSKTAEDYLKASYAILEIISRELHSNYMRGRFYAQSLVVADGLMAAIRLALLRGSLVEDCDDCEQKLAEIKEIKIEFEKLRPLSLSDFAFFLEEQTDGLVLLEPDNTVYLSFALLSSRLSRNADMLC